MPVYQVFCSAADFINDDIAEAKGWIPIDISCVKMGTGSRDISCCVLLKKISTPYSEEQWLPEPGQVWKKSLK